MSFGTGAGKGDLPRAVKGEAFRAGYDSIKKPQPLDSLVASLHKAVNEKDVAMMEYLQNQINTHPYNQGKRKRNLF